MQRNDGELKRANISTYGLGNRRDGEGRLKGGGRYEVMTRYVMVEIRWQQALTAV